MDTGAETTGIGHHNAHEEFRKRKIHRGGAGHAESDEDEEKLDFEGAAGRRELRGDYIKALGAAMGARPVFPKAAARDQNDSRIAFDFRAFDRRIGSDALVGFR
ncbi:MAG TPA: hypothetical protein VG797_00375, partial [Phycisphaerales bacterium]|nr:hypothetical protein [Phycisphaerales bacterium]